MIAILSDVHGNFPALRAVFDDLENISPSLIISLGDIAGYYPQINECVDLLRSNNVINLMGNHDYYLVSDSECPRSITANKFLTEQKKIASTSTLDWLKKSLVCYTSDKLSMVHGGWNNPLDEYLYQISYDYFDNYPQQYFFSGHTHVQKIIKLHDDKVYCNPGSVGQPRDGNPHAAYALVKDGNIQLKRVKYDIDKLVEVMEKASYKEYYYENLYKGSRIGGKIDDIFTFDKKK